MHIKLHAEEPSAVWKHLPNHVEHSLPRTPLDNRKCTKLYLPMENAEHLSSAIDISFGLQSLLYLAILAYVSDNTVTNWC